VKAPRHAGPARAIKYRAKHVSDMPLDYSDFPSPIDRDAIAGFDIDLVGFDCHRELMGELHNAWLSGERPDESWHCPFDPGCGATNAKDCPLMQRLAQVSPAPERPQ
jgi:hypothetical protein